ncbi:hypothetical protein P171DRAFT_480332 [Karstenula rhodostoma CBS 690.94]|uniref:Uncharacterized protein n=1 Tax=Karstenula rhodostoma CBS 690.94 TaxID=1392251 RepID=A0A9P4UH51_9PLEO|nr:hypothetical protein P171DRAFT_480332 [Karstenula rhodostoma CBS 690.94]
MPTHPPPKLSIQSAFTGRQLPITPLHARALRNSLKDLDLRPPKPKSKKQRNAQALAKKKTKSSPREVRKRRARPYCPSPLHREIQLQDEHTGRFPVPRLLKEAITIKIKIKFKFKFKTKSKSKTQDNLPRKTAQPISPPAKPPSHAASSHLVATIHLQLRHCNFPQLQHAAIPERGTLTPRTLALNVHQDAHFARRMLKRETGTRIKTPGFKSVLGTVRRYWKRERKRTWKPRVVHVGISGSWRIIGTRPRGEEGMLGSLVG